jgi:putative oxidoreductase
VRFTKIGFAHPYFTAHFVGAFEIACGFLVLLGVGTRAAAVPLLIVISTRLQRRKFRSFFGSTMVFGTW